MDCNFVRIRASLRMTPAMAAGVTDKLWEIAGIVALIEAKEAEKPMVSDSYKRIRAGALQCASCVTSTF